jgi:hypothetical protein
VIHGLVWGVNAENKEQKEEVMKKFLYDDITASGEINFDAI